MGNIPSFARTMRASVLEIKRMEYVDAARITGGKILEYHMALYLQYDAL